jgi:hypothetical protein
VTRPKSSRADKYDLYQRSVQDPEIDLKIIAELIERRVGRAPRDLREDFSGTANLSCTWVREGPDRRAWAVDIDAEPQAWGLARNVPRLKAELRDRVTFVQRDVLDVGPPEVPPVDLVLAMNYSFNTFTTRDQMRRYFAGARAGLREGGAFVMEVMGGPEVETEGQERTLLDGFTYVWDRHLFNPITHAMRCKSHFAFPDGSMLEDAFTYDWRLWMMPELRELLGEAGFSESTVYWEGPGEDGQGDRNFVPREHVRSELAWIAFLIAWR